MPLRAILPGPRPSRRPPPGKAGPARSGGRPRVSAALVALVLCLCGAGSPRASAETFTWQNPPAYADAAPIPATERGTIETRLYVSHDGAAWARFATVAGGAESWTGALPLPAGVTGYYGVTSTVPADGIESPLSAVVAYPSAPGTPAAALSGSPDEFSVVPGSFQDTFVAVGDDVNRSAEPVVRTYVWPAGRVANRAFFKWDLSSLPPDAEITSATLRLYSLGAEGGGQGGLLRISAAPVVGVDPALERATWASPGGVAPWTGGADGGARNLAPAEATVAVGTSRGWAVWDVTNMVRSWVQTPAANFGMALSPDAAAQADSNRYFASGEHADPRLRPELLVSFRQAAGTPPASGSSALATAPALPGPAPLPSDDVFTVAPGGLEDTFVNHGIYADINYGSSPLIATYTWPENHVANRSFLRWDLSGIPDNVTVLNATLWLRFVAGGRNGDDTYRVTVAKVAGVRPDPGRATWNRFDGVSPWPGGGAASLAPPAATAAVGRTYRWVSWDVTEMVKEWVARPWSNFGMAVEGDASAGIDSSRYFASAEHPDPAMRPQLLITYAGSR